jgi:hypothetical protein
MSSETTPFGIARADGELVHVDVGRVQHGAARPMEMTVSALGMSLAVSVVPSSGSSAMSTLGAVAIADLFADIEHRRLVALALADHDHALDVELVELGRAWRSPPPGRRPFRRRARSVGEAMAAASETRARPSDSIRSLKSSGASWEILPG